MNRHAGAVALGALFLGLLAGYVAGRQARIEAPPPEPRAALSPPPRSERSTAGPSGPEPEDVVRLKQRIAELEARPKAAAPPEDLGRLALDIRKAINANNFEEDPRGWCREMALLGKLGPELTPHFVGLYRASRPKFDPVLLELAIGSGGPELAPLLKDIFGNPATPEGERVMAGVTLTGEGLPSRMQSPLPPDPELVELAVRTLATSNNGFEQNGALGLLGLQATDASRETLRSLLVRDKTQGLRAGALQALSRVGDRSTLDFLRSYASSSFPQLSLKADGRDEKLPRVERALLRTLRDLERKFPDK